MFLNGKSNNQFFIKALPEAVDGFNSTINHIPYYIFMLNTRTIALRFTNVFCIHVSINIASLSHLRNCLKNLKWGKIIKGFKIISALISWLYRNSIFVLLYLFYYCLNKRHQLLVLLKSDIKIRSINETTTYFIFWAMNVSYKLHSYFLQIL